MLYGLKVKIKSLAAEASIIRQDENKARHQAKLLRLRQRLSEAGLSNVQIDRLERKAAKFGRLPKKVEQAWLDEARNRWLSLSAHRTLVVRPEARAAQLAYGYLRGRAYKTLESNAKSHPKWDLVERNVQRFSIYDKDAFSAWMKERIIS